MSRKQTKNLLLGNDLFTIINLPSLSREEILWLINGAYRYANTGEEPSEIPPSLVIAWPVVKAEQDRIRELAEARSNASRAAIMKRWHGSDK